MEYSPKLLMSLTAEAFILGVVLGLLYSLLRFSRVLLGECVPERQVRLPRFWVSERKSVKSDRNISRGLISLLCFWEDILFCLCAAVGIILLAYVGNNGRIRWFILLGTAVGFACYTLTLGKLFSYAFELLAAVVRLLCRYVVFILLYPLRAAGKGIRILFSFLIGRLRVQIRKRKNKRFHALQMRTLLAAASEGFGSFESLGLEKTVRTETARPEKSHEKQKDVKNKRRRRVYGRTEYQEKARNKPEEAC